MRMRRAWKKIDEKLFFNALSSYAEELQSNQLTSRELVDNYVASLTQAINEGIEASTPVKKSSIYDKSFWTTECSDLVRSARRQRRIYTAQRTQAAWESYVKERNKKGNVIAKAKRAFHRERIREVEKSKEGL